MHTCTRVFPDTDNNAHACLFDKFVLEFFHTHRGGRSNRYHFVFFITQWTDDWTCMQDTVFSFTPLRTSKFIDFASGYDITPYLPTL